MKRRGAPPATLFNGPPEAGAAREPASRLAAAGEADDLERVSDEQHRAASAFANRLISASAGTGKTRTLTAIYLRLLQGEVGHGQDDGRPVQPLRPAQVVAVTFTEKAAAELRTRLSNALAAARAREKVPERAAHLLRCWEELPAAPISTIHSFCARLLREAGARAGLPVGFQIAEEELAGELLEEALVAEAADSLSAGRDRAFAELAHEWGVLGGRGLVPVGRGLVQVLLTRGDDPEVLARPPRAAGGEPDLASVLRQLCDVVRPHLGRLRIRDENRKQRVPEALAELGRAASGPGARAAILEVWDLLATSGGDLYKPLDASAAPALLSEALAITGAPLREALSQYVRRALDRFRQEKRRRGRLDFADLLLEARERLRAFPELGQRYRFVLIDEFQDTDPLQKDVLYRLAFPPEGNPRNQPVKLAIVGDQKQSIYRFRGADVGVMAEAAKSLRVMPLKQNFRSRRTLIAFINEFCRATLWPTGSGAFVYGADQHMEAEDCRERHGWDGPPGELLVPAEGAPTAGAADHRHHQALAIARRIRTLVEPGDGAARLVRPLLWKDRALRPKITCSDIAILARSLKQLRVPLELALTRMNIPFRMLGGGSFFTRQEVLDVVNLLAWVADPLDQAARVGCLRSPLMQLSDPALFRLAEAGAWEDERSAPLEGAEAQAWRRGLSLMRHLRARLGRWTAAEMIDYACVQTGFLSVLAMQPQGEMAVAAVRRLIEQCRSFETQGARTLADVVGWLREQADAEWEEPGAGGPDLTPDLPAATDAVQIGTVHSAKGLEFPIVIVPEMGFRRPSASPPVLYSPSLGLGLRVGAERHGLPPRPERIYERAQQEIRSAELDESRRLLYVALTRARDYVILSGESRGSQETWRHWIDAYQSLAGKTGAPALVRVAFDHPELAAASCGERPGLLSFTPAGPVFGQPPGRVERQSDIPRLRLLLGSVGAPPPCVVAQRWHAQTAVVALARFLSCPRRFALEPERGESAREGAEPSPATQAEDEEGEAAATFARDLGLAAHAALDAAFTAGRPEAAGKAWDAALSQWDLDRSGAPARAAFAGVARALASEWARAVLKLPAAERFAERPFRWRLELANGGLTLRGVMDLLFRSPRADGAARWCVADYKLAASDAADEASREALRRYAWQTGIYALAAESLLGLDSGAVEPALVFLADAAPELLLLDKLPLEPRAPQRLSRSVLYAALEAFLSASRDEGNDAMRLPCECWQLDGARVPRQAARCSAEGCPFVQRCFGGTRP